MTGEHCSSTCATRDHDSFGECMRAKNMRIAYCRSHIGSDFTRQKRLDADLSAYKQARAEGIQPGGTSRKHVDAARAVSDLTSSAFQAG